MNLIRTSSFAKSTLLSSNENLLNSVSLPDEQIRRLIFSIFGVKTAHVREIWDAYASSVCSDGSKKKKKKQQKWQIETQNEARVTIPSSSMCTIFRSFDMAALTRQ